MLGTTYSTDESGVEPTCRCTRGLEAELFLVLKTLPVDGAYSYSTAETPVFVVSIIAEISGAVFTDINFVHL